MNNIILRGSHSLKILNIVLCMQSIRGSAPPEPLHHACPHLIFFSLPILYQRIVATELDEMVDDKVGCPIHLFKPILRRFVNHMGEQNG